MIGPAPEEWGIASERAGASTGGRTRVVRVCPSAWACSVLLGLLLPGAAGVAAQTTPDTAKAGAPAELVGSALRTVSAVCKKTVRSADPTFACHGALSPRRPAP